MPIVVKASSGVTLQLQDNPLGSGGEGAVHLIISPPTNYAACCVKLYADAVFARSRERKLAYMISHPPPANLLAHNTYKICWPLEAVTRNGQFCGFVMPFAFPGSLKLAELTEAMRNLPAGWSAKYDRTTASGFLARFKVAVNVAIPVHVIHSTGLYVFSDLKPDNAMITDEGRVSIVDLDSIQIVAPGTTRPSFHSPVFTAGYAPPESKQLNPATDYIPPSWDRFSLAVIFYQLFFGLHPYTGSFRPPYDQMNSLEELVHAGLFVHGGRSAYVLSRPPPHDHFHKIPLEVRRLFLETFDTGHANPNARPSAEVWGNALFQVVNNPSSLQPYPPVSKPQSTGGGATQTAPHRGSGGSTPRNNSHVGVIVVAVVVAIILGIWVFNAMPGVRGAPAAAPTLSDQSAYSSSGSAAAPPSGPPRSGGLAVPAPGSISNGSAPPTAAPSRPPALAPSIVSRQGWGAAAPSGAMVSQHPDRIVLTHDGQAIAADTDVPNFIRSMQRVHMKRWSDIAWHYIIGPDGTIYEGRVTDERSDTGYDFDTDGVVMIGVLGNYDQQTPTDRQIASVVQLMAWLCDGYGISPGSIYAHRDVAPTNPGSGEANTSPGRNFDIEGHPPTGMVYASVIGARPRLLNTAQLQSQPHYSQERRSMATSSNGIGAKVGKVWNGAYTRSIGILNQVIPPPVATRRVNPFLAAALELLGYVGFLGIGRMVAGDIAGGIKAMIMWWIATFSFTAVLSLAGFAGIMLAVPTVGFSLLTAIIVIMPPFFAWLSMPIVAAGKLLVDLKRM